MAYKPVGADENGKFPPRVEAALSATFASKAQGAKADAAIPAAEKGVASGVATLDGAGLVPSGQVPMSAVASSSAVVAKIMGTAQRGFAALVQPFFTGYAALGFLAGTATRTAMGATLSGGNKWFGGVLGPDGKIYGIPYDATDILVIDPVAGTATRTAMGATLSGTDKWRGGVLGPDGKIYGIPSGATDILVIDPVAGTATRTAMGATLSSGNKWFGGVLGPDGKIYGLPSSAMDILVIDPVAGTATRTAMGATLSDTNKWFGGVLGPDGKIYGIPFAATDILVMSKGTHRGYPTLAPHFNKL